MIDFTIDTLAIEGGVFLDPLIHQKLKAQLKNRFLVVSVAQQDCKELNSQNDTMQFISNAPNAIYLASESSVLLLAACWFLLNAGLFISFQNRIKSYPFRMIR